MAQTAPRCTPFALAFQFFRGEYTALCAAGVMTFEDGLKLVKLRGEAMQEAATSGPLPTHPAAIVPQSCRSRAAVVPQSCRSRAAVVPQCTCNVLVNSWLSFFQRSGAKKQLMLSVAGLERGKMDALCREAAAKEAPPSSGRALHAPNKIDPN